MWLEMENGEVVSITKEGPDYRRINIVILLFLIFSIVCMFISILVVVTCIIMDVLVIIEIRGQRIHRKGYYILAAHLVTFFGLILVLVEIMNLIISFSMESFQTLIVGIYFLFGGLVCLINRWEIVRWDETKELYSITMN